MANKKTNRKVKKVAKKVAKKYPKIFIAIVISIAIAVVVLFILHQTGKITLPFLPTNKTEEVNKDDNHNHGTNDEHLDDGYVENVIYDDFSIHFLELGNEFAGDSVYIKAGSLDILVDAGSRGNSATTIEEYVNKYCTDGVLEYVISTHAHQDHIAGFAGNSSSKAKNFKNETVGKTGIFYYYDIKNIIDFTYSDEAGTLNKTQTSATTGTSTVYGKYLAAREYAISKGAKYFTAKDLWDNNTHKIALTENITMDVLYNYYYFNKSSDINNYSVCTLFSYNDKHYLLTGDLEKDGEQKLAEYYDGTTNDKTLPHVELFKAGHHGSRTSSNLCLLDKITPGICVACCCAGSTEYTVANDTIFPTQEFIDRIAKYTKRVYVTTLFDQENEKNVSMNGNVIISSNGELVGISATNNLILLKNTTWFNEEIYVVNGKVKAKASDPFYKETDEGVEKIKRRVWPS